mgnify:CR=1 FL=1
MYYYVLSETYCDLCGSKERAEQFAKQLDNAVITTDLREVVQYCIDRGKDWKRLASPLETRVILLTDEPEANHVKLTEKAAREHGAIPVRFAPYRKGQDYRSQIAFDWLDSVEAKMFLYLNL